MHAIVRDCVDAGALAAALRSDACGAAIAFAGAVRDRSGDGRTVTGLTYEAYEPLALEEFDRIAHEARERFGPCEIAIHHRVGELRVGETAVAVAVAAPHRAVAFDACRYCIDELKARAPVWKKEHYGDGSSRWIENDCAEFGRP